MKRIPLILSLLAMALSAAAARDDNPNVVIQRINDVYTFVPTSDGKTLDHVEYNTEITFRAQRVADNAIAVIYYDDRIAIEKVKGGQQSYGPFFSDDIFFSDSKACLVTVDLKGGGSTAKVSAKLKFNQPEFFNKIYLNEYYDIEKADITFEIPASLAGRYSIEARNMFGTGGCEHSSSQNGNKIIEHYTVSDIPVSEHEPYSPSFNITAPQFVVHGHFADVDALYAYLYGYIPQDDPGAAAVAEKAVQLTAGATSDAERIAAITDFVHNNIRYIAVEHGELGHKPDLASEVLRKNFGDCKGSAILIRDMLRAVGIDGRLAWIGTKHISDRWTDYPSIASGNHMIAAVLTGDSILFIDGTSKYCRLGEYPEGIQGRQALIENGPDKALIADVPILPPCTNSQVDNSLIHIAPDGSLQVDTRMKLTGSNRRIIQGMLETAPPAKRANQIDLLLTSAFPGKTVTPSKMESYDDSIVISGTMTRTGALTNAGSIYYLDLNPLSKNELPVINLKKRTKGASLSGTHHRHCCYTLQLPDGASVENMPDDFRIESEWIDASLTGSFDPTSNRYIRTFTYTIKQPEIRFDDIEQYNSTINRINRACKSHLPIKLQQ